MTLWEYTMWTAPSVNTTHTEAITAINDLGRQGWELIETDGPVFWFKRPIEGKR